MSTPKEILLDAFGQELKPGDFVAIGVANGIASVGLVTGEDRGYAQIKFSSASRKYNYANGRGDYQPRAVLKKSRMKPSETIKIDRAQISNIKIHRPYWITYNNDAFRETAERTNLNALMKLSDELKQQLYEQNQKTNP